MQNSKKQSVLVFDLVLRKILTQHVSRKKEKSRDLMSSKKTSNFLGSDSLRKEIFVSLICLIIFWYFFAGWSQSPIIRSMDRTFFTAFDKITRRSWSFDMLINNIFQTNTAKIVPMLACIVWLIFERRRQGQNIPFFGNIILGSLLAMILSRLMQNFSAYRPRPIHSSSLAYDLPYGIETSTLEGWSSFPSDTSALAFSIAAGIFLASRRLGAAALLWTTVVIAFPRAYAGLHYPSDLVGGASIGLFCTLGASPLIFRLIISKVKLTINEKWMPLLWTLSFLYIFQVGTMFDDVRNYGSFIKEVLGL